MNKTIKNVCVGEPPPHLSLPCFPGGSGDVSEVNIRLSQAWVRASCCWHQVHRPLPVSRCVPVTWDLDTELLSCWWWEDNNPIPFSTGCSWETEGWSPPSLPILWMLHCVRPQSLTFVLLEIPIWHGSWEEKGPRWLSSLKVPVPQSVSPFSVGKWELLSLLCEVLRGQNILVSLSSQQASLGHQCPGDTVSCSYWETALLYIYIYIYIYIFFYVDNF